ncbi:MAG: hypothetical protein EBX98_07235 [Burkholderiaceae bacterium]|nr:hypothetical protein [Burkholderiaceae bacterium]
MEIPKIDTVLIETLSKRIKIDPSKLIELNTLTNQAKPEWLKAIERNAQKQCMVDPNAKLQST